MSNIKREASDFRYMTFCAH